ncbi:MAG: hypothetical protein IT237_14210 [Bacteroidia bacterium]|nr:hypothetical protein [Bacteroidia bacterium]
MAYIIIRAITLVITHDEAYSFYNVKHFWYVETLCTGNTHWFNFLAIKTAVLLGFEKASQLRWFTVLCSGVFLTVIYIWLKSLQDLPTKLVAFSILLLNPYLVDYLSLARGYAAGLTFQSLSLLLLMLYFKFQDKRLGLLSLLMAGVSAIANFNFFYFFTAFCFIYFPLRYIKIFPQCLKQAIFYIEIIFTLGIIVLVLKALKFITLCSNDIGEYGGQELINSIFFGYIDTYMYGQYQLNNTTINGLAYLLFSALVIMSVYGIYKYRKHQNKCYTYSSILFLIMMFLCVFNKWCLQVLYPTYRTTLMFYPLIGLIIIGFMTSLKLPKKAHHLICYIVFIESAFHFISCTNFSKTFDYYHQENSKQCLTDLQSIGAKQVGLNGEIFGVYRNYYQMTEHFKYPFSAEILNTDVVLRDNFDANAIYKYDYLVLFPPYNLKFYYGKNIHLNPIKYYPETGTLIVQNRVNDRY